MDDTHTLAQVKEFLDGMEESALVTVAKRHLEDLEYVLAQLTEKQNG